MSPPPLFPIQPPLTNSSNPWATTLDDLGCLYRCPSTGAVTTRTALLDAFNHDDSKHQYVFFDPSTQTTGLTGGPTSTASLNSLGYSPLPLETYLNFIETIVSETKATADTKPNKPFIISVTGTPDQVAACYTLITTRAADRLAGIALAIEINLSCPNIPGRPPPAYSFGGLTTYLEALGTAITNNDKSPRIPIGVKTPPYTHTTEYEEFIQALLFDYSQPHGGTISFVTAVNTLGGCLVFGEPEAPRAAADAPSLALPGMGIGGMAGAPLHPLALGNVATLRRMLDAKGLKAIRIIGIGGVLDAGGYRRMRAAGADVVGVGTALGLRGVDVFGEIEEGVAGSW